MKIALGKLGKTSGKNYLIYNKFTSRLVRRDTTNTTKPDVVQTSGKSLYAKNKSTTTTATSVSWSKPDQVTLKTQGEMLNTISGVVDCKIDRSKMSELNSTTLATSNQDSAKDETAQPVGLFDQMKTSIKTKIEENIDGITTVVNSLIEPTKADDKKANNECAFDFDAIKLDDTSADDIDSAFELSTVKDDRERRLSQISTSRNNGQNHRHGNFLTSIASRLVRNFHYPKEIRFSNEISIFGLEYLESNAFLNTQAKRIKNILHLKKTTIENSVTSDQIKY